jgi:hypothetical protein
LLPQQVVDPRIVRPDSPPHHISRNLTIVLQIERSVVIKLLTNTLLEAPALARELKLLVRPVKAIRRRFKSLPRPSGGVQGTNCVQLPE